MGVANPKTMSGRFVLTIDGVDCTGISNIGPITVRIPPGGAPQISNITLKTGGQAIASWRTWFEALAAEPGKDELEKQGTLEIADKKHVLLTLGLKGLGVARITRSPLSPSYGGAFGRTQNAYEVELYCEGITVHVPPGVPTFQRKGPPQVSNRPSEARKPPPETPPTDAPAPPAEEKPASPPAPAAGRPEDKGARDPGGAPRFEPSVRTSFTANRTKTAVDETAEYTTGSKPAEVEKFFTDEMSRHGWTFSSRSEGGKDAGYYIDVRWEGEKRSQATIVIGKAKDGSTTIRVRIVTRLE